ncbi:5792_t:CDS:1 [Dentiscutata heterogama]|uniref:5792_t:CDS:1 n=1 Tax=Dentiscutata heterogama TaxID=1316150 RepID=A0ACA9MD24_9GLOM|nr:5792_t:CDS:1 [Dentiscutata heterogama]
MCKHCYVKRSIENFFHPSDENQEEENDTCNRYAERSAKKWKATKKIKKAKQEALDSNINSDELDIGTSTSFDNIVPNDSNFTSDNGNITISNDPGTITLNVSNNSGTIISNDSGTIIDVSNITTDSFDNIISNNSEYITYNENEHDV